MKKLSQQDQSRISKISQKYVEIYENISMIEKKMNDLQQLSDNLLKELEECRNVEKKIMKDIEKRYGVGNFNPLNMCWEN